MGILHTAAYCWHAYALNAWRTELKKKSRPMRVRERVRGREVDRGGGGWSQEEKALCSKQPSSFVPDPTLLLSDACFHRTKTSTTSKYAAWSPSRQLAGAPQP